MLVLTRKKGESIMIGDHIEIVIVSFEGEAVKLGIRAPKDIEVYRKEIFDSIRQANREAAKAPLTSADLKDIFRQNS